MTTRGDHPPPALRTRQSCLPHVPPTKSPHQKKGTPLTPPRGRATCASAPTRAATHPCPLPGSSLSLSLTYGDDGGRGSSPLLPSVTFPLSSLLRERGNPHGFSLGPPSGRVFLRELAVQRELDLRFALANPLGMYPFKSFLLWGVLEWGACFVAIPGVCLR